MYTLAFPSVPERSIRMWLSFGWIPLALMGISIFFNSVKTAFVGLLPLIQIAGFSPHVVLIKFLRLQIPFVACFWTLLRF
jgi:hypothetical protein